MKGYGKIWKYMKEYEKLWKYMKGYGKLWKYMKEYGKIWRVVEATSTIGWSSSIFCSVFASVCLCSFGLLDQCPECKKIMFMEMLVG